MAARRCLSAIAVAAGLALAVSGGQASAAEVEVARCGEQSEARFPGAFSDPDNVVVGPLAFNALRRGLSSFDEHDLRLIGGVKAPGLLRAGHTAVVSIGRWARRYARLTYGYWGRAAFRSAPHTIRFRACGRRRAASEVDGSPVNFWSGFFRLRRTPACLPVTIRVDRRPARHLRLPVGGGNCREPRVSVPRLVGLGRATAVARLRAAGLRATWFAGGMRYEPLGRGGAGPVILVRGEAAPARRVTIQASTPGYRLPLGSPVEFGTHALGPSRYHHYGSVRLLAVTAAEGGTRLALRLALGRCASLDHVDVALRRSWVLMQPRALGGAPCVGRGRHRIAELRLPEPLSGRPVLERVPDTPDPTLGDQRAAPFDFIRPSPGGRSAAVFFSYGGCDGLAGTRVVAGRSRVEVTILVGRPAGSSACPGILRTGLVLVRLPSPLAGRRLVDGAR
jgi:hypothetical protein